MVIQKDQMSASMVSKDFILLLVASFLCFTTIGAFYLFPLFIMDLGGSKADIGILMGVTALSAVGVRPWVSGLVDRMGRKASFALGSMLITLVAITHVYAVAPVDQIFFFLVFLRFVFGAGLGLLVVASLTLATDLIPPERLNNGLGIFGVMPLLGLAVGPMLGELAINIYGFTGMFLVSVAINTAGLILLIPVKESYRSVSGLVQPGFSTVLGYPVVWRMSLVILCFGVAFAAHGSFVAPFAKSLDLSVSTYFMTYSTSAVISRLFGGRLASKFGESYLIPASLVVIGIGFFWIVQVESNMGLAFSGFLAGTGHGLFFPSALALSVRSSESGDRGKVTGIITGSVDAGMLLGSFSLGQLGELFGFTLLFTCAASAVILGALLFVAMRHSLVRIEV